MSPVDYLAFTRASPGQLIGSSLAVGSEITIPAAMLACLMAAVAALLAIASSL